MRVEKRARGAPGFVDPTRAAQREDALGEALRLEVAPRKGCGVLVEQSKRSLGIACLRGEVGVAKKANVFLQARDGGRGETNRRRQGVG
jgi:hypothetical protein